jgi:SAM-dependent methyltransferase
MSDGGTYTYRFEPATACVMCGSAEAKTLGRRLNGHQGLRPRRNVGVAAAVVRCQGCGLIYSNPRPVPETLGQHYERPPEDYWRETQLREADENSGIPVATFRRLWSRSSTPRALDIGAGLGQTMAALSQEGFDTWGFEPSAAFRDRAIERGISGDRLQLAAVENAEYEPGAFDVVAFGAVLEHVHDPAAALERALGWLAPDGLMFVEVPSARWLIGRLLNIAYRAQGLDYVTNLRPDAPAISPLRVHARIVRPAWSPRRLRGEGTPVSSVRDVPSEVADADRSGAHGRHGHRHATTGLAA